MGLYRRCETWWVSFSVAGRQVRESTGTGNKKLAESIYAKKLNEIAEGKFFKRDTEITMAEVFEKYLKEVSPSLSPTTDFRNRQMIKNMTAFLGEYYIGKVTPAIVSQYKAFCQDKKFSSETILRELGLLRRIFNISIDEWELCKENPVPKALKTLARVDNKRVRYLNDDELTRLMAELPEWLKPIVTLALHTGLRRGNLISLTWNQVDFEKRIIIIPKTKNGLPIGLPLTETASETITRQPRIGSFVFCDAKGPHSKLKVSQAFLRAGRRAGIEDLRFHDLRHCFASYLVQSGVSLKIVQELLGHKDLRMTLRYAHLTPENLKGAVKVLDEKHRLSQI